MATRKIIFLIISGILLAVITISIFLFTRDKKGIANTDTGAISVWVIGGTSEQYDEVFSGFKTAYPQYANTEITVRVFSDYALYQRMLLSNIAEGGGPDIFMIEYGSDQILPTKVLPIPGDIAPISNFSQRYEEIFLPLLSEIQEKKEIQKYILGVPLGYETLGMFYNKSLLRTVPRTWSEFSTFRENELAPNTYAVGIGLSPRFTQNAADIIALFYLGSGIDSILGEGFDSSAVAEYKTFADIPTLSESLYSESDSTNTIGDIIQADTTLQTSKTLRSEIDAMELEKLTTVDLFARGKMAILIGYPSLMTELEKAQKRAGEMAIDAPILTEKLPQESLGSEKINIARYSYLALSKNSANPLPSALLLSYLMSDEALLQVQDSFPTLLSPVNSLVTLQENTSLSSVFGRTKLAPFIPGLDMHVKTFEFGVRTDFEKSLYDILDKNTNFDINEKIQEVQHQIKCEIAIGNGQEPDAECLSKE